MTRRFGIAVVLALLLILVAVDWTFWAPPDPYGAPDPMAFGSISGASGALCTLAPLGQK